MKKKYLIIITIALFSIGLLMRLLPHPANFSPVMAIALFAGVYLGKKQAIFLPLLLMLVTDIILGFYDFRLMAVVYLAMAVSGLAGYLIRRHKNIINIASMTLAVSLFFFISTNLAVWVLSSWYPHTLSGLMFNFTLAMPFFRNTLFGNIFYVVSLFGAFELIKFAIKYLPIYSQKLFSSKTNQ